MPAPGQSPFDGNPNANPSTNGVGYRPGDLDYNGAQLSDDSAFPADPATMPTSALFNTYSKTEQSLCRMIEVAAFAITAGASPVMSSWSVASNVQQSAGNPFTIVRNAAGDYSVTWTPTPNLFPLIGQPRAWINALIGATNSCISAVYITNGVRIQTTQGGALTDLNFSVALY